MKEFKDLASFKMHLDSVLKKQLFYEEVILRGAAELIEEDAKRKFGVYQHAVGPFPEWAPLAEATMEDRIRKGFEPNNPLYRTGNLMDSIHHRVNMATKTAVVGSDSDIMVWQEKGTPRSAHPIPPRPVLGPAAFESKKAIQKIVMEGLSSWLLIKPVKKTRFQND